MAELQTKTVWGVIGKQLFAILGMLTKEGEARTVGITYIVEGHKLYITSQKNAWKVRHIGNNPHVSMTIPICKRIPLVPFIKIPSATITFSGEAVIFSPTAVSDTIRQRLYRNNADNAELVAETAIIEVTPKSDFVTYGIGVPTWQMANREKAGGRVSVV